MRRDSVLFDERDAGLGVDCSARLTRLGQDLCRVGALQTRGRSEGSVCGSGIGCSQCGWPYVGIALRVLGETQQIAGR